MISRTFKTV
jgi:hypothetical protein